jgi:hypothetical protein
MLRLSCIDSCLLGVTLLLSFPWKRESGGMGFELAAKN